MILKQVILITTFRGMFIVWARRHRYAGLRSAATSGVDHESHPDILASSLSEQLPLVNPQTRQASQSILVVPPAVSIPTPQAAAKMASAPPADTIRRFSTSRVIGSTNFSSYNPSDLAMTAVPTPALPIAAQMSSSSRVQFLPSPRGHNHDHIPVVLAHSLSHTISDPNAGPAHPPKPFMDKELRGVHMDGLRSVTTIPAEEGSYHLPDYGGDTSSIEVMPPSSARGDDFL